MERTDRRIALVTGANKGIGLEIARQLGRAELTVLIAARDAQRGQVAADLLRGERLDAHPVVLDVTDAASFAAAAESIERDFGRLDVRVNNAGISDADDGPADRASLDAVRRVLETNFVGPLAVTQAMLPLLRQAPAGRIVNLSSSLGSLALNGDASSEYYGVRPVGYNASKAALNMLTVLLAEELRDTHIVVNAACPGYVKTDLNGRSGYLSLPEAAAVPVRLALLRQDRPTGAFIDVSGVVPW